MFYHRDIAQYAVQGLWGHARDRLGNNIVDADHGVDTDNDDSDCCGGYNNYDGGEKEDDNDDYDDDDNGIDAHFVTTALLPTTTLIHHVLFNHQPGHLRRGALHAR